MTNRSGYFILIMIAVISALTGWQCEKKSNDPEPDADNNISEITVRDMDGNEIKLSDYKGKVLLIVNVASECGYTYQYEALQGIYEKYNSSGFEILAFPCNDFGGQEPGTNEEIKNFCTNNFAVKFKLFDKIKVLGEEKSPLYRMLTNNAVTGQSDIKWNFEKFLVSKEGNIIARFNSKVEPDAGEITRSIERELDNE